MGPPRTTGSVSLREKRRKNNGETTPDPWLGFPVGKRGEINRGDIPNKQPGFPRGKRARNERGDPCRTPGSAPLRDKRREFNGGASASPRLCRHTPTPGAHPHPRLPEPRGRWGRAEGWQRGGRSGQSPGRAGTEPGAAGAARAGPYLAHPCGCPFWSPRPSMPRAGRAAPGPRRRKRPWEM